MWTLLPSDDYNRRFKWYEKKRRRELQAILYNLDTFFKALAAGAKPQQVRAGFVHPEPHGVLAILEKGGGGNLRPTRLYVFPDEDEQVLHLLTIGDKQSQGADIAN